MGDMNTTDNTTRKRDPCDDKAEKTNENGLSCDSVTSSSTSSSSSSSCSRDEKNDSPTDTSKMSGSNSTRSENADESFYTPCSSNVTEDVAIDSSVDLSDREEEGQENEVAHAEEQFDLSKDRRRVDSRNIYHQTKPKTGYDNVLGASCQEENYDKEQSYTENNHQMRNNVQSDNHSKNLGTYHQDPKSESLKDTLSNITTSTKLSTPFSPELHSFITSISSKASPLRLKSWVALSLTLDGRDKITKVIQYTSRFLGFYYETLASGIQNNNNNKTLGSSILASYIFKAKKFRRLYKALTTSRKAYRFGRTFIEIEKLKTMGLMHWIAFYLRSIMFNHGENIICSNSTSKQMNADANHNNDNSSDNDTKRTIKSQESTVSFHPDTKFKQKSNEKEVGSVPPRILLPRQVSSNIGYKPSSFLYDDASKRAILKQLSTLGRFTYLSLSSVINDEMLVDNTSSNDIGIQHEPKSPPPLWKILSSALKLIGLAGFWAGDNISYLYSIGFLVDDNDPKKITLGTKSRHGNRAALFATRSYFFAAVVGLYHNAREWYNHRNGVFQKTMRKIEEVNIKLRNLEFDKDENKAYAEHMYQQELESLEKALEQIKHKHFNICLALLKSCCDVTVFSNNPGVDLHLKYRGQKMNEGIQCLCGTTSALTVIYNNYPSMKLNKK